MLTDKEFDNVLHGPNGLPDKLTLEMIETLLFRLRDLEGRVSDLDGN